jgi:hypothetical protein
MRRLSAREQIIGSAASRNVLGELEECHSLSTMEASPRRVEERRTPRSDLMSAGGSPPNATLTFSQSYSARRHDAAALARVSPLIAERLLLCQM